MVFHLIAKRPDSRYLMQYLGSINEKPNRNWGREVSPQLSRRNMGDAFMREKVKK